MTEDWPEHADEAPLDEATDVEGPLGEGAEPPVDEYADERTADPGDLTLDEPSLDPGGHVRTGNVTVDAVLASMEGLDEAPVAEHVAVFEHAHEQLRAALDGAGDGGGDASPADGS
ncbi:hypothetical protein EKO23_10330 [Nocardioides guangzhouensis]|uniref:Uncharacterized protein n=1 Tax=Nocardioides guangzhouensis TaxID=2497878 RepID=A0A4Q4ZDB0_9ACTN|nr:hypothetical protein [Nocardioides guangzhouensis]RYP86017.1 hypothetical protein EKO23_10330 [Nocardioides guangzhouensis]